MPFFKKSVNLNGLNHSENEAVMESNNEIDGYISKSLSDNGKCALAAVCANILQELYYNDFQAFCVKTLDIIMRHLAISHNVEDIIRDILVKGNFNNKTTWISILTMEVIPKKKTKLLVQDLIGLALMDGSYDARWRILIQQMAALVGASDLVEECESAVANFILRGVKKSQEENSKFRKRQTVAKLKRYALITAVAAGSGAVIGLTGGLAAPAIVEGMGAVIGATAFGATTVTVLSTPMGTAAIASLFGAAGASVTGYKMTKRVGEIKEFAFGQLVDGGIAFNNEIPVVEKPHLNATISISGWIKDYEDDNFSKPWKNLYISEEQYCLQYESSQLYELGQTMEETNFNSVKRMALQPLKYTVLLRGPFKLSLPTILIDLLSIIDLPWSVACSKAILVGKQLAEVLLAKEYGCRPITLIGYSLGARVIYYCLLEMSEREGSEGILENVYLIGAPCPADPVKWHSFTRIISGTIFNAYSDKDYILKFFYRTLSLPDGGVAGLKPIDVHHSRLKNEDLSEIISGHSDYPLKLNRVLKKLNVRLKSRQ